MTAITPSTPTADHHDSHPERLVRTRRRIDSIRRLRQPRSQDSLLLAEGLDAALDLCHQAGDQNERSAEEIFAAIERSIIDAMLPRAERRIR